MGLISEMARVIKEEKPRKSTLQSVGDAIYNPNKGTFMGRDLASWGRILGFYFVYYSFLACLFYGTVMLYQGRLEERFPVAGTGSMLKSRIDQPGASVWPHNDFRDDKDNYEFNLSENLEDYIQVSNKFLEGYEDGKTYSTSNLPMDLPNFAAVKKVNLREAAKAGEPIVFVSLNQLVGWQPVNKNTMPENIAADAFIADAVYFECRNINVKDSVVLDHFSMVPVEGTSAHIEKKFYSFDPGMTSPAQSKKPFVAFQVKGNGDHKLNDGENHLFKCNALADNIQPQPFTEFNDQAPQAKLRIGSVTFGFKMELESEE